MTKFTSNTKKHQTFKLSSGIRVLHINEPEVTSSSVAFCVQAGQFDDPNNIPGLAHLFEHMLFMGSFNHPEKNALGKFLSPKGGSVNAWTSAEFTNFHFSVKSSFLAESLSIFSDMLLNPLFNLQHIEAEINTIDEEYKAKKHCSLKGFLQVQKEIANPNHPFSRFATGNKSTFAKTTLLELQSSLRDFHQRYYVSNNITLSVLSNIATSDLQQLLESEFKRVSISSPKPRVWHTPAGEKPLRYQPEQLGKMVEIRQDSEQLVVSFPLETLQTEHVFIGINILGQLFNHAGPSSIRQVLKKHGWISKLSINEQPIGSFYQEFSIAFALTDLGISKTQEIIQYTLATTALIKDELNAFWRIEEILKLQEVSAIYQESLRPVEVAIQSSVNMHFDNSDLTAISQDLSEAQVKQILHTILDQLHVNNMHGFYLGGNAKISLSTQWYDTAYSVSSIKEEALINIDGDVNLSEIALAPHNPYIIKNLVTKAVGKSISKPTKLKDTSKIVSWFCNDSTFNVPKGDVFIAFDLPADFNKPTALTLKNIWAMLAQDLLSEQTYMAEIAGIHCHIYAQQNGFTLKTSGFAENQLALVQQSIDTIHNGQFSDAHFQATKTRHLHRFSTNLQNKPISLLFHHLAAFIQVDGVAPDEKIKSIKAATLDTLNEVKDTILSAYSIEALIYGNWSFQEACETTQWIESYTHSALTAKTRSSNDINFLDAQTHIQLPVMYSGNQAAVIVYLQTPTRSHQDAAVTYLLDHYLSGRFFNDIRGKSQLGYHVGCGYYSINRHPGIAFYVQSNNHDIQTITHAINEFIEQQCSLLNYLQTLEFESIKQGVCHQLQEKDVSQSIKAQRIWLELGDSDPSLSFQNEVLAHIQYLTIEQFRQSAQQILTLERAGRVTAYTTNDTSLNMTGTHKITNQNNLITPSVHLTEK